MRVCDCFRFSLDLDSGHKSEGYNNVTQTFQIRWRRPSRYRLDALWPDWRAGRHAEAGEGWLRLSTETRASAVAECLLLCALDSAVTAPASHESRIAIIEWWCKFIPSPLDAANIQMTSAVSAVFQIRHGQCRVEHSENLILSGENIFAVLKVIRFAFPKIRIFSHL